MLQMQHMYQIVHEAGSTDNAGSRHYRQYTDRTVHGASSKGSTQSGLCMEQAVRAVHRADCAWSKQCGQYTERTVHRASGACSTRSGLCMEHAAKEKTWSTQQGCAHRGHVHIAHAVVAHDQRLLVRVQRGTDGGRPRGVLAEGQQLEVWQPCDLRFVRLPHVNQLYLRHLEQGFRF